MPDQSHKPLLTSRRLHAFFHPAPSGRLFTLYRRATSAGHNTDTLVLFVAAFGEEMNASRRAYTVMAQTLAENGISSLMFDFYGTGDSDGDFDDADWVSWQSDLETMLEFARSELKYPHIQLLGLRSGALHIAELLSKTTTADITQVIFWQPLLNGCDQVDQFLRLRLAANLMLTSQHKPSSRESTQSLRAQAKRDGGVEVAGYGLTASMIDALDSRELTALLLRVPHCPSLHWLELAGQNEISGARAIAVQRLIDHGISLASHSLAVKRFWSLIEAPVPATLIQLTRQCVLGGRQ